MSNAVLEEGSPLAEYLDDGPTAINGLLGPSDEIDIFGSERKGAIIRQDSEQSLPISRDEELDEGSPIEEKAARPTPRRSLSSDRFSEQFKYLICSSALLEKDYVPGYRALDEEKSEGPAESDDGLKTKETLGPVASNSLLQEQLAALLRLAQERWNITLAGLALLYGVTILFGWLPVAILSIVALALIALSIGTTTTTPTPRDPIETPAHSRTSSIASPSEPRSASLEEIKHLIESCRYLDDTIEKSLSRVTKQPGNIQHLHPLRLALNQLNTSMVDHIATATSSLLKMGDKEELAVLGGMYDVQLLNNSGRPGKRISLSSDDSSFDGSVPGPRDFRLNLSLETPHSTRYAIPMTVSHSYPGLGQSHRNGSDDPEDRFTQMPIRTPRSVKRPGREINVNLHRSPLSESSSDASPRLPSHGILPAPFTPNPKRRSLQTFPINPLVIENAVEHPYTSRPRARSMRSPLSETTHTIPSQPDLKSPFTPNPKRRSLQNMPYNPPTLTEDANGADLTRTRSMPFSDIQSMRSRYATGRHSRSTSLVPPPPYSDHSPHLPSSPNPRTPIIRRVVSVSPLTLPSLKAACLDIHLRRRRMACCLLGLQFDNLDEAYWVEVDNIMRTLAEKIDEERRKLDTAIGHIVSDLPATVMDDVRPPWSIQSPPGRHLDYAPRTADSALLTERIEEIQKTLDRAWTDLVQVKTALNTGEEGIEKAWIQIRTDLGSMVRDWERGREVIKRMTSEPAETSISSIPEDTNIEAVPPFAKAWSDTSDGPPMANGEPDEISAPSHPSMQPGDYRPDDFDEATNLPLPGQDEVFEAEVTTSFGREKSTLSRGERIALTKQAREQGLSLKELLESKEEDYESKRNEREVLKQGGMVVDELKGVMEIIRAKKAGS